jgi:hypothetical protein
MNYHAKKAAWTFDIAFDGENGKTRQKRLRVGNYSADDDANVGDWHLIIPAVV